MKNVLCILCLLSLFGCNSKNVAVRQQLEKVQCNIDEVTLDIFESDIFKSTEIVPIKAPDDVVLGGYLSVSIGSKYLYVADYFGTYKVYRLSHDGELINSIGAKGKARNEYLGISDFYVDDDKNELTIYSGSEGKELVFDTLGNLKRARNHTAFMKAIPDSKGTWLYLGYTNLESPWRVVKLDLADSIVAGDLKSNYKVLPMREGTPVFTRNKKDIYIRESISNIVHRIENDSIIPSYEFDFGKYKVPEALFTQSSAMDAAKILFSKEFVTIRQFMQNDDYVVVDIPLQSPNEKTPKQMLGVKNLSTAAWQWFKTPFEVKCLTQNNELIFTVEPLTLLNYEIKEVFGNSEIISDLEEDGNTVLLKCVLK